MPSPRPSEPPAPPPRTVTAFLCRLWSAEPREVPLVLWAAGFFFCLLCGYFVLRPLRDALGSQNAGKLNQDFLGTFVVSLLAWPLVGLLLSKVRRRRLAPWFFRLSCVQLLLFWALWHAFTGAWRDGIARAFFVWLSVFNVFAVSLFWGLMADVFQQGQARRLFGAIGAGGTLGAIAAAPVIQLTTRVLPAESLFVAGAVLLELGVQCGARLLRAVPADVASAERGLGGSVLEGFSAVARSPYLVRICLYMAGFSLTGTLIYLGRSELVKASGMAMADRTRWFGNFDLAYNLLTVPLQLLASGRMLLLLGIPAAIGALPALVSLGFGVLGCMTTLVAFSVFEVVRRVCHYAVSKPALDVLFTVVSRSEKYKARSFIDTIVFRGSDWLAAVAYDQARPLTTLPVLTFALLPVALVWTAVAVRVGKQMEQRARTTAGLVPPQPAEPG